MDETVYQCPECNFNADNLTELDGHITEFHSNMDKHMNNTVQQQQQQHDNEDDDEVEDEDEGDGGGGVLINDNNDNDDDESEDMGDNDADVDGDGQEDDTLTHHQNTNNINSEMNDDFNQDNEEDEYLVENEIQTNSTLINPLNQHYLQDDENEYYNNNDDDYYYENQQLSNNYNVNKNQIQNKLNINNVTNTNNSNKAHNLRQKQPIDYNNLNGTSSSSSSSSNVNNFSVPQLPQQQQHQQQKQTITRRSVSNQQQTTSVASATPVSALDPNVPVINSDNHYERQYTCKRCGFFTNNPRAVLYHRKEFHFEKINVHECSYCQYASQYSGKVERHTLLRHKIDINNSPNKKLMNQRAKSDQTMNKTLDTLNLTDLANTPTSNLNSTLNNNNNNNNNMNNSSNKLNIVNRNLIVNQLKSVEPSQMNDSSSYSNSNNNSLNLAKFQCNKCPCKYKRSSDLSKHLKLKHGILAQRLSDYLTTSTSTPTQAHSTGSNLNDLTSNDQDDLIDQTNQHYADETDLNEDLFNEHEQETDENKNTDSSSSKATNSYECPYCTYQSNGNDAEYLLHVKDHLAGKSFRCVLCNSVYKYRGDCVVHLKRKHQKADSHAQSYVERFNMEQVQINEIYLLLKPKQQEETENEEKLFSCAYCDYKANYKGDVFKHQTRRHPGSPKNLHALIPHSNTSSMSQNDSFNMSYNSQNNKNDLNQSYDDVNLKSVLNRNASRNQSLNIPIYNRNKSNMYNNKNNDNNQQDNNKDDEVIQLDNDYNETNNEYYNSNSNNRMKGQQTNENYIEDESDQGGNEYNDDENMFTDDNNHHQQEENDYNNDDNYEQNDQNEQNDIEIINDYNEQDYTYQNNNNEDDDVIEDTRQTDSINQSNQGQYQCKFCSFVGKNHAKLQLHLATHYNLKPYMCPVCNRRANFKWDIQKHLRKIHNDYTSEVICLSEQEARQSISSYIENNKQMYDGSTRRPASSLSSMSNNSLNSNKFTSMGQYNDEEEINDDQVFQDDDLNGENVMDDDVIDEELGDDINQDEANLRLMARQRTENAMRERKFKCTLCNRTSKWQWDIRKHLRTVHRGQPGGDVIILREPTESVKKQTSIVNINNINITNTNNNNIRPSNGGSLYIPINDNNQPQFNHNVKRKNFAHPVIHPVTQKPLPASLYQPRTPINGNAVATCSDPTGNKKFQCTQCPYRSNWKADLFRHLKKRHFVQQPQLEHIVVLDSEYAASSLEEYEQVHGIHVRKRRPEFDMTSASYCANSNASSNDTYQMSNETKKAKLTHSDSQSNSNENDQNLDQQENIDMLNQTNRLPVSIAELNIKPYKCLKCGFRSDRKSDTLRHIRVKHGQTENTVKFLRIMSIAEASESIEAYENMRLYKKIKNFNSVDTNGPNIYAEANIFNQELNETNYLFANQQSQVNQQQQKQQQNKQIKIQPSNEQSNEKLLVEEQAQNKSCANPCCDNYRCPFCSFKNKSKLIMRRHLAIHFTNQKVKINPTFKCSICCFKSKWKFLVKKHILMNHLSTQNAYVLKVAKKNDNKLKKQQHPNLFIKLNEQQTEQNQEIENEEVESQQTEVEEVEEEEVEEIEEEQQNMFDNINSGDDYNNREEETNEECEDDSQQMDQNRTDTETNLEELTTNGEKTSESVVLTDNDGTQFTVTFTVSNPLHHSIGSSNQSNRKKVYFCLTCPYKTSNYSNFRAHLFKHRYQEGDFKCRYCEYYVSKVRLLKQHEILHPEYELRLNSKQ